MKRIELEYKDGNNNAEFLVQVLKEIEKNNPNSYCYLSVIDAIPNDQEQFAEEKGMFSEEVLNLNKMVQNNHGIEITFEKLMHVLKKCRTVWDMSFGITNMKNDEYKPSLENNFSEFDNSSTLLEFRIIEGDLITILTKDNVEISYLDKILSRNCSIVRF